MGIKDEFVMPYPDFQMGKMIDPEQHDLNNAYIKNKLNEFVTFANEILGGVAGKTGAEQLTAVAIEPFTSTTIQGLMNDLITRLKATQDGLSGASLIASPTLTKLAGNNVEAQLKALDALLNTAYVITSSISDGAITNAKLGTSSVTSDKILNANVTNEKLANGSVSTDKILNGSVTNQKMAQNSVNTLQVIDGAITNFKLALNSVSTDKIQDSAVVTAKIADSNVTTNKLANQSVTSAKLGSSSVGTDHVQNLSITTNKLAEKAVTTSKLGLKSVTSQNVSDELLNILPQTTLATKVVNLEAEMDAVQSEITNLSQVGIPKFQSFKYSLKAVVEGQTDFAIPLSSFDDSSDTVFVIVNTTVPSDFTIVNNTVVLANGVSIDTSVTIIILKNVPAGQSGTVSGRVIIPGSLPLDRIQYDDTPEVTTLAKGEQTIEATYDSLTDVTLLDGDTIVNHVPLFDSGAWNLHANATVNSPSKITHTSTTTNAETNTLILKVKPSTTYTLSLNHNGRVSVDHYIVGGSINIANTLNTEITFTTLSDTKEIKIYIFNDGKIGTFTFENVSLVEGTTAKPFVANVKGITNPTIENKTNGTSVTLKGTFHKGDRVFLENNEVVVERVKKEIVLDGSESWISAGSKTGYKQVFIPFIATAFDERINLVKYNGSMVSNSRNVDFSNSVVESFRMWDNGRLYVDIPNTDSGWGDSYTPTSDEIKAYFLGWKMANTSIGWNEPYNGSGVKGWARRQFNNGGLADGSGTLPTTQAPLDPLWQPYRLIYDLATPIKERVEVVDNGNGLLTLDKGINTLEVTEGRIVREVVRPIKYNTNYHINYTREGVVSSLKNKTNKFIEVYKNGDVDTNWSFAYDSSFGHGGGVALIEESLFDPTAVYEADYIPLEPYKVTAPLNTITIEYQSNLGSVVGELVEDTSKLKADVQDIEQSMVRKGESVEWLYPTLLNGWVNYGKSYGGLAFSKDSLNSVKIMGTIKDGNVASSTLLFKLPTGYRPKSTIMVTTLSYTGSSLNTITLTIQPNGDVTIGSSGAGNYWISLDSIPPFKAEQ